jgi:SAM-dependent methyltransferase
VTTSGELRGAYDTAYYEHDCGGHAEYALFGGRKLEDARLGAVHALAAAPPGARVLDIGCGRGELAYAFAAGGAQVTALDYSEDALALARATAGALPVRFVCTDAASFDDAGGFDVAVASDVIEHLAPPELDALYARLAALLAPAGTLVIHTWPNAWMYRYGYPRRRRAAALRGEDWPADPRTPYERAMHVNEQRPNALRRQLRRCFPHAEVWLGTAADPRGSLARPLAVAELRDASDVFAVASHRPLDRAALLARITTPALTGAGERAALHDLEAPPRVAPGAPFALSVSLRNDGAEMLSSFFPHPVRFADVWLDDGGRLVSDAGRSPIAPPSQPGSIARYLVRATAPTLPGRYTLRVALVQELVGWFGAAAEALVEVV